jgi:hypothetical protein
MAIALISDKHNLCRFPDGKLPLGWGSTVQKETLVFFDVDATIVMKHPQRIT